jgi:hypothetical protein
MQEFSIETQFQINQFNRAADQLSREQAIEMLKETYLANVAQRQSYEQLIGASWGVLPAVGE